MVDVKNELKSAAVLGAVAMSSAVNTNAAEISDQPFRENRIENVTPAPASPRENDALDYQAEKARLAAEMAENITYNTTSTGEGYFTIKDGDHVVVITESELKGRKIEKTQQNEHKQKFSHPTEYSTSEVELEDRLSGLVDHDAQYLEDQNAISINSYTIQNKDKLVERILQNNNGLSRQDAENLLENVVETVNKNSNFMVEHEKKHRDNDQAGLALQTLSPEYMAKLNMMDEISANMTQAGLALEQYRKNGDLIGFETLSCDMGEVKKFLQENPEAGPEECRKVVATTVYNNWLETNNRPGATYSNQAYDGSAADTEGSYHASLLLTDHPAMEKEYRRRVDVMFQNIPGLGDVRDCINPDFKLNPQLQEKLDRNTASAKQKSFMDKVVEGTKNLRQATRKIKKFFSNFKKADQDQVRTDKEKQKLANLCFEKSGRVEPKKPHSQIVHNAQNTITRPTGIEIQR